MTATLWASPTDRHRIAEARFAVLLIGGYDGSGNYGDVLQLAATLETVRRIPGSPLAVPLVERAHLQHSRLLRRHPALFADAAFIHYDDGAEAAEDGLMMLPFGVAPSRSALCLYGGGYLNHWWGARKVAHVAAVGRLVRRQSLPVVASGLQVEEPTVAPGGVAHPVLARASWIGVRDIGSLESLRRRLPERNGSRVELTGDDAVPALCFGPLPPEPVVNLHLHQGEHVSEHPEAVATGLVTLLKRVAQASGPLELQPVSAYEDPRISESAQAEAFLGRWGGELEAAGLRPLGPLNLLDDALDDRLGSFRRARLTISCSYHVALSSLLAGIPTVLLAENGYYDQKAAGLRDLFELEPGLVGVPIAELDSGAVAAVIQDGPTRTALTEHLRTRAREVLERQARGREAVSAALSDAV